MIKHIYWTGPQADEVTSYDPNCCVYIYSCKKHYPMIHIKPYLFHSQEEMQLTTSPMTCSFLIHFFVLFALCFKAKAVIKLPPNVSVPAVIAFGDSIVDSGNNNHLKTLVKCNFPPYGKDFQGGVPTGRFCNGKIPSDILGNISLSLSLLLLMLMWKRTHSFMLFYLFIITFSFLFSLISNHESKTFVELYVQI